MNTDKEKLLSLSVDAFPGFSARFPPFFLVFGGGILPFEAGGASETLI
jgi:hypothetical protein